MVTQRTSNLFYATLIREPANQQVLPGTPFRYVSLPASIRLSQRSGWFSPPRIGPTAHSPVKARGYYARATAASSAKSHVFHALLASLSAIKFHMFLKFNYRNTGHVRLKVSLWSTFDPTDVQSSEKDRLPGPYKGANPKTAGSFGSTKIRTACTSDAPKTSSRVTLSSVVPRLSRLAEVKG